MRIELNEHITIRGARRILTKRHSDFRITMRNGRLYTFRRFNAKQPNSPAQLNARDILRRANELARTELNYPSRRLYWTNKARTLGYKTAVGCCRAYFIALLKADRHNSTSNNNTSISSIPNITFNSINIAHNKYISTPLNPLPSNSSLRRHVPVFTIQRSRYHKITQKQAI